MDGVGTYRWNDGRCYTGSYKKGERDGYGELKKASGTTLKCQWYRNRPIGNIIIIGLDGVIHKTNNPDNFLFED